jgi:hypothetical protein
MTDVREVLRTTGITDVSDVYSTRELATINAALDPLLAKSAHLPRSYVYSCDMLALGILDLVLSPTVMRVFFDIIDDPVLYHFHVYEIARSNRSHVFAGELNGWHCDPDSVLEPGEATHVSLFVYLSDVGPRSGAFEFLPGNPEQGFRRGADCVSRVGPAGTTFLWNRSYFHRASPNKSAERRRLLKISVQSNRFPSRHLSADHFAPTVVARRYASPWHQVLFGAYQGMEAPAVPRPAVDRLSSYRPPIVNGKTDVPAYSVMKHAIKQKVGRLLHSRGSPTMAEAAYD